MNWLHQVWRSFGRDQQIALLLCAIMLAFFAYFGYAQRQAEPPLPPLFVQAPTVPRQSVASSSRGLAAAAFRAASNEKARLVVVHVAGAVRRPGLQRWPVGARVVDAVRAAGGATSLGDIQALNLAQRLRDGERIVVLERGAVAVAQAANTARTPSTVLSASLNTGAGAIASSRKAAAFVGVINLNTASAAELEILPGIGPALAARIITYRSEKGHFSSLDDLDQVKGLGPKKLQTLQRHVTF